MLKKVLLRYFISPSENILNENKNETHSNSPPLVCLKLAECVFFFFSFEKYLEVCFRILWWEKLLNNCI